MSATKATLADTCNKYSRILQENVPGWSTKFLRGPHTSIPPDGYSFGWISLNSLERQRAQIFCLRKILWCIFEELPSCNTCLTIETFHEGIDQRRSFPYFDKTPPGLRGLIHRCTANAPEWTKESFPVIRNGNKLVPRYPEFDHEEGATPDAAPDLVQRLAREWWDKQVAAAVEYVQSCKMAKSKGHVQTLDNMVGIDKLEDVLGALMEFSVVNHVSLLDIR
ncbi:hypothetical protein F4859DRAFT_512724 [Xylaria cf. heliscus]|nr:hypothetical protein F4859DRAFT_512724 [Xylaria cf. heliscus]